MNEDRLYRLIGNPDSITDKDRKDLDEMAKKWPWCNSLQLLDLKAGHIFEPVTYQRLLKNRAPAVTDRKILYRLIHTSDPKRLQHTPVETVLKERKKEEEKRKAEAEKAEAANKANLEALAAEKEKDEKKTPVAKETPATEIKKEKVEEKVKAEKPEPPATEEGSRSKAALADEIMKRIQEIKMKREERLEEAKTPEMTGEEDKLKEEVAVKDTLKKEEKTEVMGKKETRKEEKKEEKEAVKKKEISEGSPEDMLVLEDGSQGKPEDEKLVPPAPEASRGIILDLDYTLPPEEKKPEKEESPKAELIEKFIKEEPRIIPKDRSEAADRTDITSNSPQEIETTYVTETLAGIYTRQGYYEKAIQVYEKLVLKNPEKSAYFATQIKKLRKSLKNN